MRKIYSSNKKSNQEPKEYEEKVIEIKRVSKKTKGGNKIGFSALVVVGDKKGKVGVGLGKAPDTLSAIKKGIRKARKNLIKVPIKKTTIPFPIQVKRGAALMLLKPAPLGTGVIAGAAARAVVEAAGIRDIVVKILGTNNKASNVYATFEALSKIYLITRKKGIKIEEISGMKFEKKSSSQKPEEEKSKKKNSKKRVAFL